jgi:uncharacterized protein (TIGR03032 family)
MPELLDRLGVSLWVTTYQAGKVVVVRSRAERLSMLPRTFNQAMGLALSRGRIAVGSRSHIWFLENEPPVAATLPGATAGEACYLPRRAHITGNIRIHEIAWDNAMAADGRPQNLWLVNTLFSCLCTLDERHSFIPRWQPPFIKDLKGEDRCHLNGIALRDGQPKYVTALAASNEPDGWRSQKLAGGCLIEISSGATVLGGLCMPHSPRWHNGKLWLLNSGRGELLRADAETGAADVVSTFPGYPRGLALTGEVGFVGLSQVRETATFGGIPLTKENRQLKCGVWAVDLESGRLLGRIEFQGAVAEIFDVQLLRGLRDPFFVGLEKDTFEQVFVVPAIPLRQPAAPRPVEPASREAPSDPPGTVVECRFLGRRAPFDHEIYPADVYYVRYVSAVDQGSCQSAKLHVPIGNPPGDGWPTSIWCHGLGDPATQLYRWPLVPRNWHRTRGRWAGRWANMGVATLTPWMPGDGPSEPLGTYSPYSLQRNGQALADAFLALTRLAGEGDGVAQTAWRGVSPTACESGRLPLNLNRMALRTDCVASSLLVHFVAHFLDRPHLSGLRVLVADDFQPGVAHSQGLLGPALDRLPARDAAAVRCIWMRVLWALFEQQKLPLHELVSNDAYELFAAAEDTPAGRLPRIYATRLVPAESSSLADRVVARLERLGKSTQRGMDVNQWMHAPRMFRWTQRRPLSAILHDEFYRAYLADADPFFSENIAPFCPKIPLLVVGRAARMQGHVEGLPGFEERFEQMTVPKVETLRSWGWQVDVLRAAADQGSSFGGGAAQQWVFQQLDRLL